MPRTKEFDKSEIIEKAMKLFWKQGFHATSMSDLVENLGINRASLYNTFKDKKGLFMASLKYYQEINLARVEQLFDQNPNPKIGLKLLFYQLVNNASSTTCSSGCYVVNSATELLPHDHEIELFLKLNASQFHSLFGEYMKKGISQGFLTDQMDTDALAKLFYITQNGIQVVSKSKINEATMKAAIDQLLSVLK